MCCYVNNSCSKDFFFVNELFMKCFDGALFLFHFTLPGYTSVNRKCRDYFVLPNIHP